MRAASGCEYSLVLPDAMNKWQIICPLAAMGSCAVLLMVALHFTTKRNFNRQAYLAGARMAARELAANTNSSRVTAIGPGLKEALDAFLASPAGVVRVQWRAAESGGPGAGVLFTNQAGERLFVRFRWNADLKKWAPVSHVYPVPASMRW